MTAARTPGLSLIAIQDEYISTINAGFARWSHRKRGGHYPRVAAGARRQAMRRLAALGYDERQSTACVDDARDVAVLERETE